MWPPMSPECAENDKGPALLFIHDLTPPVISSDLSSYPVIYSFVDG